MAADKRIVGYRRVLTGFRSCRFCAVASTQRYHKKDLLPLHYACDCVVAAIWGTEDPGWIINRELLNRLQQDSDRQDYWNQHGFVDDHGNPVTSPKKIRWANRDVTVKEHGELGPTLVSDKHHFTGPDQIKRNAKADRDVQKLSSNAGDGGGGGPRRPSEPAGFADDAGDAARQIRRRAEEIEPSVTKDVREAADAAGADLAGLDDRLKSQESIQGKLERAEAKGQSISSAAANLNDSVRYSGIADPADYVDKVNEVLDGLKAKGYTVESYRNAWAEESPPFRALNVTLRSPEGDLVEVQLHTPEAFAKNKETHELYEERRDPSTSQERRDELEQQSKDIVAGIEVPHNASLLEPS